MLATSAQAAPTAEHAFAQGAFDVARRLTAETIESGAHDQRELARLYELLARAHAALGDHVAARRAFTQLLALRPEFRLAREEPAQTRSPYLEARGFWSTQASGLAAVVSVSADRTAALVSVSDPAGMAARVRLRVRRAQGETYQGESFVEFVRPPADGLLLPLQALRSARVLEYSLALLDEHGNRLWQRGSDQQPDALPVQTRVPVARDAATDRASPYTAPRPLPHPRPYYVGSAVAFSAGAAAIAAAGLAHARREKLAQRWNRGTCDGSGNTRGAICADERRQVSRFQLAAGVLYGVGASALVTGVLVLVLAPSKDMLHAPVARSVRCDGGPGLLGLGCTVGF